MATRKNRALTPNNIFYVGKPDSEGNCLVVFRNGSHRWMTHNEMPSWLLSMGLTTRHDRLEEEFSFI